MIDDWKLRQKVTNALREHGDDLSNHEVVVTPRTMFTDDRMCQLTVEYFIQPTLKGVHYPEKSYAVRVIYAKLLEKYFDVPFYTSLSDPELLPGDPCGHLFHYGSDKRTYDLIVAELTRQQLWDFETNPVEPVRNTVSYFKQEFMLS